MLSFLERGLLRFARVTGTSRRIASDWPRASAAAPGKDRYLRIAGRFRSSHAIPFQVSDVIRKSFDWKPASRNVIRDARYDSANLRPPGDLLKGGVHRFNEFNTKARPLTVVPDGGILIPELT